MFLEQTQHRNPALIEGAQELHKRGEIEPDTYVIDLDTVDANARAVAETAAEHTVEPWFVVKQVGRNPLLSGTFTRSIPRAAAIDVREARTLLRSGAQLGNVGRLVQIPRRALRSLISAGTAHCDHLRRRQPGSRR